MSSTQVGSAPSADELAVLLGKSHSAFQALTHDRGGATCEWKRYSKKAPWVMKVSEGDRTLFYLTPQANQFEVTVVLGERAAEAALAGRVRKQLHAAIRSAKPYVEGRPQPLRTSPDAAGQGDEADEAWSTSGASEIGSVTTPARLEASIVMRSTAYDLSVCWMDPQA
jgi:hypothetical protein